MAVGETRSTIGTAASPEASLLSANLPMPADFPALLYGRCSPEDIAEYSADQLTALAGSAWTRLAAPRSTPDASIHLHDVMLDSPDGSRPRQISVLEVLNDDKPFLLDSALAELTDAGLSPLLVAHPILHIVRDKTGNLLSADGLAQSEAPAGSRAESLIQIHLPYIFDAGDRERLVQALNAVYADVSNAVSDFKAMRTRIKDAIRDYKNARSRNIPLADDEIEEATRFLRWLITDNFTLLGTRIYHFPEGDAAAEPVEGSSLGILRDPSVRVLKRGNSLVTITPALRAFLVKPEALIISKANVKSRVHRRAYLDYIGVKLFDETGKLSGELRIVGLFTSNIYTRAASELPYLGHKVAKVMALAGFDPDSYSGRALTHALDTYPRDELFQVDADTLYGFALELLKLSERPRVRVLSRVDEFDRFVSVLVYVPKDHYDTKLARRIGVMLADAYQGRVSAMYPAYPEGPLTRTQFIIGRDGGPKPQVDARQLEDAVRGLVRTWTDALAEALEDGVGGEEARLLTARYGGKTFSAAYREAFDATETLADIRIIEALDAMKPRAVDFYRRATDPDERINLKVFTRSQPMPLSERVPLLENLGFRVVNERTYRVFPPAQDDATRVWLHDMTLERFSGQPIDIGRLGSLVEDALMALFDDRAESDRFNTLITEAALPWRDVALLRAFARYLQQAGITYTQGYLAQALVRNAEIAKRIVALFHARFLPGADHNRDKAQATLRDDIAQRLGDVTSLDDDQILRRFTNLVDAALRTNFYQQTADGQPRSTISFKIASGQVEGLPLPRPLYEISVYSPRVEGIHLRFGKVARGGLRWSDRPQDFRTEILGLVKAQQVKNAVIVPVGAKGGFVAKRLPNPSDRQAWLAEGIESYKIFVSSLLDLTDNIEGDRTVPPALTVRHDGDDPYLVVAADKGTATFSDIANGLSEEHHHWLGDAFASGGSQGYDHKKMGITARGAWEAVKRHFREIDIDIQTQPVSVVGVGDMSGDVFGNGMLLSPCLKLIAAFDHRDIFIDPTPDPAVSHAERQRLFDLPRSSWQDYDKALISEGGGIFSRQSKQIRLSPEAVAALGLPFSEATPQQIVNAILKAPADLLWFGGIGTYVRSGDESNEQVGDRANDPVRVAASELRCRVIGEGANLGCTQRGRIEAAQNGVRLNTDAIDNSAGVNTSDVEVNIKIALATPQRDGRLDYDARNTLLATMTGEVGTLVLRNNYLQTLAISLSQQDGLEELGYARRLMQMLESAGRLDRAVETLPDDIALSAREKRGEALSRPEIAVLLAYAKLDMHDQILDSSVPDEPFFAGELQNYFPPVLYKRFPDAIEGHRLRREIVSTQLANAIVNHGGPTILPRLMDQTGADAATIARAFAVVSAAYHTAELNSGIDALDGLMPGQAQLLLYADVRQLLIERMVWFIRHVDFSRDGIDTVVATYCEGVAAVAAALKAVLPESAKTELAQRVEQLRELGLPEKLAERMGTLPALSDAPDIVRIAGKVGIDVVSAAETHYAIGDTLRLAGLVEAGHDVAVTGYFDRLALDRAIDAIASAHRRLTTEVLSDDRPSTGAKGAAAVAAWAERRGSEVERIRGAIDAIVASGLTLSKLTVAASLLGDLARA